jgi:hypothetical protein
VRDLEQAQALLGEHGPDAEAVVACLVQVTRREWPECRSLSGAVQKYLGDARKLLEQQRRREAARLSAEQARQQAKQSEVGQQREERRLQEAWDALPEDERAAIVTAVRARLGGSAPDAFVQRLCLAEVGRMLGERGEGTRPDEGGQRAGIAAWPSAPAGGCPPASR